MVVDEQDLLLATRNQLASNLVHDADFLFFENFPKKSPFIMDIEANRGQSIASFHAVVPDAQIHAFEANPEFFKLLQSLKEWVPNLYIYEFGLGREPGRLKFYIPYSSAQCFLEEATTKPEFFEKPWIKDKYNQRGGLRLECTEVRIERADSLGIRPDIVKLDVEGAEYDVLLGMVESTVACKPVFLIENGDWHNVTPHLSAMGYKPYRWETAEAVCVPFWGETTNTIYIHNDALEAFASKIKL